MPSFYLFSSSHIHLHTGGVHNVWAGLLSFKNKIIAVRFLLQILVQ
jgi:hypothetical protein